MGSLAQDKHALFVKAAGLESSLVSRLWNNIQLSPEEEEVRAALQIVAHDVERISVRIDPRTPQGIVPIVKLQGANQPVPLRTMGAGMLRLFNIALAMANARDGFLLLDEIENGLHHSIQLDVWRLIFRLADRLNVQVLASTHSWDCIEAFQKATAEAAFEQGMLIRLREKGGKFIATGFDQRHLRIVTRDDIEVR
jgi:ABC-type multidrug transport system ATPase subunit